MAEIGSVLARLKADLSAFDKAFANAAQTFSNFKRQVEGQAISVKLNERSLNGAKRQLRGFSKDIAQQMGVAVDAGEAGRAAEAAGQASLNGFRRSLGKRYNEWLGTLSKEQRAERDAWDASERESTRAAKRKFTAQLAEWKDSLREMAQGERRQSAQDAANLAAKVQGEKQATQQLKSLWTGLREEVSGAEKQFDAARKERVAGKTAVLKQEQAQEKAATAAKLQQERQYIRESKTAMLNMRREIADADKKFDAARKERIGATNALLARQAAQARAALQVPVSMDPRSFRASEAFRGSRFQQVSRNLQPRLAFPPQTGQMRQVQQIAPEFKKIVDAARPAESALAQMARGFTQLSSAVRLLSGLAAASVLMRIGEAAKDAVVGLTQAGIQGQRMSLTMRGATGSTAAAADEMRFLWGESQRLGTIFEGTVENFAKLAAATRQTSLGLQGARDIFTGVAEAATGMGLSSREVDLSMRAITQTVSKGTIQLEELRGQLGEQIPGAFQTAARSMGYSSGVFEDMLRHGMIPMEEFLPRFAAELKRTFADVLPDATQRTEAEINRLRNVWNATLRAFANDQALTALSQGLKELREVVGDPKFQASVVVLGNTFANVLAWGLRQAADAASAVTERLSGLVAIQELEARLATQREQTGQLTYWEKFKGLVGQGQEAVEGLEGAEHKANRAALARYAETQKALEDRVNAEIAARQRWEREGTEEDMPARGKGDADIRFMEEYHRRLRELKPTDTPAVRQMKDIRAVVDQQIKALRERAKVDKELDVGAERVKIYREATEKLSQQQRLNAEDSKFQAQMMNQLGGEISDATAQQKAFARAQELASAMEDWARALQGFSTQGRLFGQTLGLMESKADAMRSQLQKLTSAGLTEASPAVRALKADLDAMDATVSAHILDPLLTEMEIFGATSERLEGTVSALEERLRLRIAQQGLSRTSKEAKDLFKNLEDAKRAAAADAFATGIGQALQGFRDAMREAGDALAVGLQIDTTPLRQLERVTTFAEASFDALGQKIAGLKAQLNDPKTYQTGAAAELSAKIQALTADYVTLGQAIQAAQDKQAVEELLSSLRFEKAELQGILQVQHLGRIERDAMVNSLAKIRGLMEGGARLEVIDVTGIVEGELAIAKLGQALEDARGPLRDFLNDSASGWVSMQEGIRDAFLHAEDALVEFFSTGKLEAEDFFQSILEDISQMFTRQFLTKPLMQGAEEFLIPALQRGMQALGAGEAFFKGAQATTDPAKLVQLLVEALGPMQQAVDASGQAFGKIGIELASSTLGLSSFGTSLVTATGAVTAFTAALQSDQVIGVLKQLGGFIEAPGPYSTKSFIQAGFTASGGVFAKPSLRVIGEAGPEAVVPLRGGGIPAMLSAAGRLVAPLPSGAMVPIMATATGGVYGATGMSGVSGGGGGDKVSVTVINNAQGTEATTRESRGPGGTRQIEILVDQIVAKRMSTPGSATSRSLRTTYGAQPGLVGR